MTLPLAHHYGCSRRTVRRRLRQSLSGVTHHSACAAQALRRSATSAIHPVLPCPSTAASGSVQLAAAADRMPYAGPALKRLAHL